MLNTYDFGDKRVGNSLFFWRNRIKMENWKYFEPITEWLIYEGKSNYPYYCDYFGEHIYVEFSRWRKGKEGDSGAQPFGILQCNYDSTFYKSKTLLACDGDSLWQVLHFKEDMRERAGILSKNNSEHYLFFHGKITILPKFKIVKSIFDDFFSLNK